MIDHKLKEALWDVDNLSQVVQEFEISVGLPEDVSEAQTPYQGKQFSDYVLLGRNGKPLAVVEAKKATKDPEVGREQAKQYCYHIQRQFGGPLPFCFFTNGHEIFFWDLENYPPRKVVGYPTRDDLERFAYIRDHRKSLSEELINTEIAGRDYQIKAIRAVMEGIAKKQRNFLLVMATGTGKTRTCIALVDALMRAGHVERVLFLVDRIALRDQGLDGFKEHLPHEPRWPHEGEKDLALDRRIYIATYPTMLNVIRSDEAPSPHFFDLIVIDESHRSIYNTYGEVLDYFKTLTLGLTATPTDIIDHNTFRLFNCDDGVPTFAYTYEQAVNNRPPYLCNFQVMKIHTKFQDEGISKRTITLEDQKKLIIEGKDVEEINFEGTEIEKTVINRGTNALIVKEFMEESIKDPNGVLPGKTIFFCSSMGHARRLREIFDTLYPEYQGELAKVLVSDDPRVHGKDGLLAQFTKKDMPRIALSVDMLDTGIDVREIVNLVFAKPVYSYTKFWQMIGRGTRLLEPAKKKPWCVEKDRFLILDCWDNFEYFKLNPKGKELVPQIPLPVRFVGLRLDKIEKALDTGATEVVDREATKLRDQIAKLPANSVMIQDASKDLSTVTEENFWTRLTHEKMEYLRTQIKPLFRTLSQVDFKIMRFEKDLLETSLALLAGEKEKFGVLRDNIIEVVGELPLSVNLVHKEAALIKEVQSDKFWAGVTEEDFETLAQRIGPLVHYRDPEDRPLGPMTIDLRDSTKTKEWVEFGPEHSAVSVSAYREMVERTVMELTSRNPILQKIKEGQSITEAEAQDLAQILHDEKPYITEDLLKTVYQNRKAKFLQFMRHILGLEVLSTFSQTVEKAFEEFIQGHSHLNGKQLEFLGVLKDFILQKETVKKGDLIEAPFTVLHPNGIRGVFGPGLIEEIVDLALRVVA